MSSSLKDITEWVFYLVAGIGAVFVGVRRSLKGFDFNLVRSIESRLAVSVCLDKQRLLLQSDRVDLITTHNGGGKPKPETPLFASLFDESISKSQESYLRVWRDVPCDKPYLEILHQTMINNHKTVIVEEMEESVLQTAVTSMNLKTILFTDGFSIGKQYFFFVVSWEGKVEITDHIHEIVRRGIMETQEIISQ